MESKGWKFIIDLHTQMVGEEALSFDSAEEDDEKQRMEPDNEGVLWLEGGSTTDYYTGRWRIMSYSRAATY